MTLSPASHATPAATRDNPSEVFFTNAISSGCAPTSRAKLARIDRAVQAATTLAEQL
jgi:hypothetical protein